MIRKLFCCWLTAVLLGPTSTLALEVGEIQVQSALNQLFDARIPLPSLTPEQLARISVKLAPSAMFKEFGLDEAPALKHLVFSLQYDADGEVYVKIVSTQPIREPSLGLLLEFGWPRGRTFREYTVLLDPVRRLAQQPRDRTRTILDSPVGEGAAADSIATPETSDWTGEWWFPPGTPSAATGGYQPGETYGPVAPGEGLWGIALKIRPDPNISREHMMQALFQANPQAFTSAGINGLKSGVLLRIPTFQEIADLTGSVAARQRAEAERSAALAAVDSAASTPVAPPRLADGDLRVFPLTPPPVLEPTPVETPPLTISEEPVDADSELAMEPVSEPESEPAPVVAMEPEPESKPQSAPVVAEEREPAPVVAVEPELEWEPEPIVAVEPGLEPKLDSGLALVMESESVEPLPVLVSATPLLLLAVSEMTASLTQIPAAPALRPLIPALLAAGPVLAVHTPHPSPSPPRGREFCRTTGCLVPPHFGGSGLGIARSRSESVSLPIDGIGWLATIEQRIPQVGFDWLLPAELIGAKTAAESLQALEQPAPVAEESGQYGPIVPNERLWTIAAKLRPDPSINTPIMMQALFAANPQAFYQGDMNFLKVDAILRIPTLREIVEYTGSRAARRLLELEQQNQVLPAPANGEDEFMMAD